MSETLDLQRLENQFNRASDADARALLTCPTVYGDCTECDGYILAASEAPYCPTCARLKAEGKDL